MERIQCQVGFLFLNNSEFGFNEFVYYFPWFEPITHQAHRTYAPINVFPQRGWRGGGIPWGLDSQSSHYPQEFDRRLAQGQDVRCLG